ncbi:MAG: hypothetical protein ABH914_00390 [Candidatus Omnitrophota bacterium]
MSGGIIGSVWAEATDSSFLSQQRSSCPIYGANPNRAESVETVIAELAYPGLSVEELEAIGDKEQILIEKSFGHEVVAPFMGPEMEGPDKSGNYSGVGANVVARRNRGVVAQFIGLNVTQFIGRVWSLINQATTKEVYADGLKSFSAMVYIPKFTTSGMPQAGLDGLEMGGFWMDKYEASQPDATAASVGSTPTNTPGITAAVSQAGVVVWHTINWANAKTACHNRGQTKGPYNPSLAGTTTTIVDTVNLPAAIVGRHIVIVQGAVTYYARRITAYVDSTKTITFTPALPAATSTADTYTSYEYHLTTAYEWASVAYWCCMHTQPKGNNSYGNDSTDSDADGTSFGRFDPTEPSTEIMDRVLTGTGPRTWSHNQEASGVWDLNANVWEWIDLQVTANGTTIVITTGFPGAGYSLPTTSNYITQLEATDAVVKTMAIPSTLGAANPDYGNDYYSVTTTANTYAAIRGGYWAQGAGAGVFYLFLRYTPSYTDMSFGFRACK